MNIKSKIRLTIYSLLIMSSLSCQEKKSSSENNQKAIISMNDDTIIPKVLKKQLQEGASQSIDEAGAELVKIPFDIEELGVTTFGWTQKLSPHALSLRHEKQEKELQFRV
ncbi:hypothetical protein [Chryseobacterium sp.]|uniref:hypothetical protein n=1 Tax=Chryseobacterium sp. TaxID=1871047 RepID=UPI0031D0AB63